MGQAATAEESRSGGMSALCDDEAVRIPYHRVHPLRLLRTGGHGKGEGWEKARIRGQRSGGTAGSPKPSPRQRPWQLLENGQHARDPARPRSSSPFSLRSPPHMRWAPVSSAPGPALPRPLRGSRAGCSATAASPGRCALGTDGAALDLFEQADAGGGVTMPRTT